MPLSLPSRILFVPSSLSGLSMVPVEEILGVVTTPVVVTGVTTQTVFVSLPIPVARLRMPSLLEIEYQLLVTNNANTKTIQVRLNDGTTTLTITNNTSTLASVASVRQSKQIVLTSATQVSFPASGTVGNQGGVGSVWTTDTSLNINSVLNVSIATVLSNAADSITLQSAVVRQASIVAPELLGA